MSESAPHSINAERAVLSALLVRPDAWRDVRDVIGPDDFWRSAHQTIFRRMEGLVTAGRAVDLITLTEALHRHQELEAVGGAGYITKVLDGVAHGRNAVHYAQEVRDHALRRQCLAIADQLRADALAADDVDEARTKAENALRTVNAGRAAAFTDAEQAAHAALDEIEAGMRAEHGIVGTPTGLHRLDLLTGGLMAGDLIVIGARPSVGKTALATQAAGHAALECKVPVLFVTLETRSSQLVARMASNLARVDLMAVREGRATDAELARLNAALERVAAAPITFLDSRDVRLSDVRRHARLLHAQGKCGLLVVDYLGLLAPERAATRSETREVQVSTQSRLAKTIARELGVPFVMLAQLNREYERRDHSSGTQRPKLSDLRDSGAIEQDADVVLLIHRPYVRPENMEQRQREGETDLIVAKSRNGPVGRIRAVYEKSWVRFSEVDSHEERA